MINIKLNKKKACLLIASSYSWGMDVTCSLCSVSVNDQSKRRKRLHGESTKSKEVKATLFSIAEDSGVSTSALELNANAYLCYHCNLLLCNVRSTKVKLGKLLSDVKKHLLNNSSTGIDPLSTLTTVSDEQSVISPIPGPSSPLQPSPAKRPCPALSKTQSPDVRVSLVLMHALCSPYRLFWFICS